MALPNITREEANKQLLKAKAIMDANLSKFTDIAYITETEVEQIWKLRGLLWEVAHHVSSKSRKLHAQHEADKEDIAGAGQTSHTD